MKTCNIITSFLFGAVAVAAPLKQRALRTTTVTVLETVTQYTTLWNADAKTAPPPASTPAYFYENQGKPSTTKAAAPAYTPPASSEKPAPTSVYTPPPPPPPSSKAPEYTPAPIPTPTPTPEPVYTPPPAPVSSAAPAPKPSAPAPQPQPQPGNGNGQVYDTKMTVYDIPKGAYGACSTELNDNMMIVALEANMMGASTYNSNGEATNQYCGKKIIIDYKGKKTPATIADKCPGCPANGIDLTRALWAEVVGADVPGDKLPVKWSFA